MTGTGSKLQVSGMRSKKRSVKMGSSSSKIPFDEMPYDVALIVAKTIFSWADFKHSGFRTRIPGEEGAEAEGRR